MENQNNRSGQQDPVQHPQSSEDQQFTHKDLNNLKQADSEDPQNVSEPNGSADLSENGNQFRRTEEDHDTGDHPESENSDEEELLDLAPEDDLDSDVDADDLKALNGLDEDDSQTMS